MNLVAALNRTCVTLIDGGGPRSAIGSLSVIADKVVGVAEGTRSGKDREKEDESGEGVSEHLGFL